MAIVLAEERAAGWAPHELGAAELEKQHGCDILSTPPQGGAAHPVEVKGWGEPFLAVRGRFAYHQDMRESQMKAARCDNNFRIELVANLTAYLAGSGPYERLRLTATEIRERAGAAAVGCPATRQGSGHRSSIDAAQRDGRDTSHVRRVPVKAPSLSPLSDRPATILRRADDAFATLRQLGASPPPRKRRGHSRAELL